MSTTTDLSTLIINYLTQSQYDTALANGEINENELYLTPDVSPITFEAVTSGGHAWNILKINLGDGTAFCQCWSAGIALSASTYAAWGSYSAGSSAQMFYHDYSNAAAFPVTFKYVPTCRVQSANSQSMVWSFWSTSKTNLGTVRMIGQSTTSRTSTIMVYAAGLIDV